MSDTDKRVDLRITAASFLYRIILCLCQIIAELRNVEGKRQMSYYTERHGMRAPIEKTDVISYEMYSLLFDCCERYFDNIAWKYPDYCPDGNGCCGIDLNKLNSDLSFEIPGLFRGIGGWISKPQESFYHDKYDQYA